ncbi:MAG TPA: hypothetical protein VFP84_31950, partial [Kofleriaceae bacterium]|nr:hypothetical protein [Kofleriaceae bacterium]
WSQKSDDDDELKRLNLSRQRELKQLKDEFKDILDGGTQKPSAPSKKPSPAASDAPPAGQALPSGSPDQGAGGQRVTPGSDRPSEPAAPTVQPGDSAKKPAKKKPAKTIGTTSASAAKGAGQ